MCDGNCLIVGYREERLWFVAIAHFCGINTTTMSNIKLPMEDSH